MTDLTALALTIWGEARGEPIEGKVGVGWVVRNRVLTHYRGAQTYAEVCLAHAQFSAWVDEADQMQAEAVMLTGDARLSQHPDPTLRLCLEVAAAVIAGTLADNTNGSNHYYADTIQPPLWTQAAGVLAVLGHHRFFKVA